MDCLYDAYIEYLKYLRIPPTEIDFVQFRILKKLTHGFKNQYVFGGAAPWIIWKMTKDYGFRPMTQYTFYGVTDYWDMAHRFYKPQLKQLRKATQYLIKWGEYVKEITFQPAIYLLLTEQHAVFQQTVPNHGYPIMAIQL